MAHAIGRYIEGEVSRALDAEGNAIIKGILAADECDEIRALYPEKKLFRSAPALILARPALADQRLH